tara:strand:+ start:205 stop:576 length:372 start_codon:yes stop_codon:yes gene_type:complete
MKMLRNQNLKDLKGLVYDLIARTSIEIGHRADAKTMVALAQIFAKDLMIEKRFGKMCFEQIDEAFRIGVRFGKDEPFLNIRTFYKWTYAHKKKIDNAEYEVRTLGKDPKNVPYYNNQKLIGNE